MNKIHVLENRSSSKMSGFLTDNVGKILLYPKVEQDFNI